MQWSVGRVIKTIFETRNLTSPREKMIVGLNERKKKERGGKKKTKSLRNVATSCLLTVVSGYLDHFIRQNCRRKRRDELSYGHENYIAEAKWRTKGAASFRKLGGRRKRGVTRRDSSRASFREIFHSTPRRPCYTAASRDKR